MKPCKTPFARWHNRATPAPGSPFHPLVTSFLTLAAAFVWTMAASVSQAEALGRTGDLEETGELIIDGEESVHIAYKRIQNAYGPCVTISSSAKVIVENSYIGPCKGEAIVVTGGSDVLVRHNYIKKAASGLYAVRSKYVRFHNNYVKNVMGPRPRGQMVQFNEVTGAGNNIQQNIALNILGESLPEDVVNLYRSQGTSTSPILVQQNYLRGGGPSTSGGGIMSGDNGGAYERIANNIVLDPGQYGIAVAGGTNMTITGNQVYAKRQSFTNVGLYAWNQKAPSCSGVEVSYNKVSWLNKDGASNPWWDGKNCGTIKLVGNDFNATYTIPAIPTGWGPNWPKPADF